MIFSLRGVRVSFLVLAIANASSVPAAMIHTLRSDALRRDTWHFS
jgi:hypothetical protein